MKVVILAGGLGTRISEESHLQPKPMLEIGGRPILWHIMKIYAAHGFTDFVICLGYKGYCIKEYFANYFLYSSDITFDFSKGHTETKIHQHQAEPWRVTLVDTGLSTMTGGRLGRIAPYLNNEPFMLTYGDGVGDVDIGQLLKHHREKQRMVTVTAIQPSGRFGSLKLGKGDHVEGFQEKPKGDGTWISAGFFVMEPAFLKYVSGDNCILEKDPLEKAAQSEQLCAYRHEGFWHPMDTLRDKKSLEQIWDSGNAPWKIW